MEYSYLNKYRNKANICGKTSQEQLIQQERDNFDYYLNNAPNRFVVEKFKDNQTSLNEKIICTVQDHHFNDSKNIDGKILCCKHDENIAIGDLIVWNKQFHLVYFEEKNTLKSHKTLLIKPCNNILTFEYDDIIHKIPCILSNATLYSDGIEIQQITMSNDQRSCIVPYNEVGEKIRLQQRFAFNHNSVFSASLIDDFTFREVDTNHGLIQITLIRETHKNNVDDLANNLADNSHLKEDEPIILQIDNKPIQLEINKTYQLNPKLIQENKEVLDKNELDKINYITENSIINIKNGLITGVQKGNTNIQISYKKQVITIPVQIVDNSVNSSNCSIVGNDFIKIGKIGIWNVELYNGNGNKINGKVEWEIIGDNISELIKIKEKTDNSITILAIRNQENIGKKITIRCKTLDGLSIDSQEVIIKNLI